MKKKQMGDDSVELVDEERAHRRLGQLEGSAHLRFGVAHVGRVDVRRVERGWRWFWTFVT